MQESIHKYFKIGTIQWMSHPPADRDVLTSIRQIACDDFFDAIEVCKFDTDEARAKAKKMLEQGHMTAPFIQLYYVEFIIRPLLLIDATLTRYIYTMVL